MVGSMYRKLLGCSCRALKWHLPISPMFKREYWPIDQIIYSFLETMIFSQTGMDGRVQIISAVKQNESFGFKSRVEVGFPVLLIEYFAHLNSCAFRRTLGKKVTHIHDRGSNISCRLAFSGPVIPRIIMFAGKVSKS